MRGHTGHAEIEDRDSDHERTTTMSELADAIERMHGDLAAVGPDAGSVDTSTDALRTVLDALAEALDVAAERGAAIERVRAACLDEMTEAENGGMANVGALFPSDVLAELDGEDAPEVSGAPAYEFLDGPPQYRDPVVRTFPHEDGEPPQDRP
jgi:hypothetical protein